MVHHSNTGWNLLMTGFDLLDGGTGTSVVSQWSESGQGILGSERYHSGQNQGKEYWVQNQGKEYWVLPSFTFIMNRESES